MDVAFIADNQNSLLKVLDISEKSESDLKAQRNIMVQYNSNNVGTIQSISVDHPNAYYRQKAGDATDANSYYRDSAYLYLISDDGTNGGLMRLNATDPLASGIGTVPATGGGHNTRLLAPSGLNKDSLGASTLTHVFASQSNVFVAGTFASSSNSKVAFFTNQTLLDESLTTSETAIDVDDKMVGRLQLLPHIVGLDSVAIFLSL